MSRTLLIAARPYDLSSGLFDAFVERHVHLVALMHRHYEVRILLIRPAHDASHVTPRLSSLVFDDLLAPHPPTTRSGRLARAARSWRGPRADAETVAIGDAVNRSACGRAVTFGPWLNAEYQPVFQQLPTLHFFEEDLSRMPENAPQSLRARALRRAEVLLSGRARSQPRSVVYISPPERLAAESHFRRSNSILHPLLLDPASWPIADQPSSGDHVLVVGQFAQARNAEGLRDVLDALAAIPQPPPVNVVSGAGLHTCLDRHLASGHLTVIDDGGDLYGRYREAAVALVPARRMTGVKTTILQAWAAGCPVVCFPKSAESLGPFAFACVEAQPTPQRVAHSLFELMTDEHRRADLAGKAKSALGDYLNRHIWEAQLLAAVRDLQPNEHCS